MHKLRIAVAGAGLIGKVHADIIRASTECGLSAIVDPCETAQSHAKNTGCTLVFKPE